MIDWLSEQLGISQGWIIVIGLLVILVLLYGLKHRKINPKTIIHLLGGVTMDEHVKIVNKRNKEFSSFGKSRTLAKITEDMENSVLKRIEGINRNLKMEKPIIENKIKEVKEVKEELFKLNEKAHRFYANLGKQEETFINLKEDLE